VKNYHDGFNVLLLTDIEQEYEPVKPTPTLDKIQSFNIDHFSDTNNEYSTNDEDQDKLELESSRQQAKGGGMDPIKI
jgi:hypothetical protein